MIPLVACSTYSLFRIVLNFLKRNKINVKKLDKHYYLIVTLWKQINTN